GPAPRRPAETLPRGWGCAPDAPRDPRRAGPRAAARGRRPRRAPRARGGAGGGRGGGAAAGCEGGARGAGGPTDGGAPQRQAVAETLEAGGTLVAEAGTGTGKTYAYLAPALLSGGKVLVSTGTKTLQDQLYTRDLPQLVAALQMPATIALLKGRSNYVCHLHL